MRIGEIRGSDADQSEEPPVRFSFDQGQSGLIQGLGALGRFANAPASGNDLEIGAFIEEMDLPNETIEAIFCNNTLDWLNLSKEQFV